jgi:alkylation response protein AidB-like acyl-CoA dehydrogenase
MMAVTTEETVRAEVKSWLAEHFSAELTVGEWWDRLTDSGWGAPTWPREWFGLDLSRDAANVVAGELRAAGAIGAPAGLGVLLAGPTIITHGSNEQKERYLRPILTGQEAWCQLFSEPGAGSDLAGLQTRAERDGDEWVVNGQKVWTSGAQTADLGMLLARTDPDAPKHKGITYFALPMDQPGVEVRPLREMTGRSLFSEVFFDDARVPDSARIGGLDEGWIVANTTLANERAGLGAGGSGAGGGALPGRKNGMLDVRVGALASRPRAERGPESMVGRATSLLEDLARSNGVDRDPLIRQRLAQLYILSEVGRMTAVRARAARAAGRAPGGEGNLAKLMMSEVTRLTRDLGPAVLGAGAMLVGPDSPSGGIVQEGTLFAPAVSIYGGSDQIQRNIIGERVLGLPKEPGPDRDTPFRELRVGTQTG